MQTAIAPTNSRNYHAATEAEHSDVQLMARLRQKDIAALELFYDRHHQIALGLACKIVRDRATAEDVVQDAFLALWRQPERFDPAKGTPRGWLLAIVHHRSIDKLRRARPVNSAIEINPELIDECQPDPCDVAVERIQAGELLSALELLPGEQRRAIELAFIHGRTHVEIAALMDCPLGTVKGRIRIGLARMRTHLSHHAPLVAAGAGILGGA